MLVARYASVLALALTTGLPMAYAADAAPAPATPVVKTTCTDYLALDETVKPKFIYYAVGHTKKGREEAVLDVVGTDKIQPELDEFCKVNLNKSAYQHVLQTSMASEHGKAKAAKAKK